MAAAWLLYGRTRVSPGAVSRSTACRSASMRAIKPRWRTSPASSVNESSPSALPKPSHPNAPPTHTASSKPVASADVWLSRFEVQQLRAHCVAALDQLHQVVAVLREWQY